MNRLAVLAALSALLLLGSGCGKSTPTPAASPAAESGSQLVTTARRSGGASPAAESGSQLVTTALTGDAAEDVTALCLADVANDFQNATAMACESIDSGQAASKLEALIRETNRS